MTAKLPDTSWMHTESVKEILAAFTKANITCRFVGGCVRDALLNYPIRDIDIATPATPERVMELLKTANIKAIPTGLKHGTVTAVSHGQQIEITTLRRDIACDGRHAEVEFTDDWQADAARRDFTMNALYADAQGFLTDFWDGAKDARDGHVRFIGDPLERIREDALRILRFFRFHSYYGAGEMDEEGLTACAQHAVMLDDLSGERIQSEMFKLLLASRAAPSIDHMQRVQVALHVFSDATHGTPLSALKSLEQRLKILADPIRALAALLRQHSNPGASAAWLKNRWKLSGAHSKHLSALCEHTPFARSNLTEPEQKRLLRQLGRELFIDQALLAWTSNPDAPFEQYIKLALNWTPPAFPLDGAALIAAGFKEGPALGKLLSRLESHWEEQGYTPDKEALLKVARQS